MFRRKGPFSSSNPRRGGAAASRGRSPSAHRSGAGLRHTSASAAAVKPHTYFPKNAQAAQSAQAAKSGATTPHMRSRAPSIVGSLSMSVDPFDVVRARADSKEPHMAQSVVVLDAISELLREKGVDTQTSIVQPTHYFGVLMVLLEQRAKQSAESIGAIMFLLSLLLPRLPHAVLKSKQEPTAAVLIEVLEAHADDAHIAKHVLECASGLLSAVALDSPAVWSGTATSAPSVARLMQVLLVYSLDHRPRIRRAGQDGVKDTLRGMHEASLSAAPTAAGRVGVPKGVCDLTVAFCLREISQCTPKEAQTVLFLCGLLQGCIQYLSVSAAAKILEALLSMVGRGNSILMVQTMRTLDAFFQHASEIHLTAEVGAKATANPTGAEAKSRDKFLRLASQLLQVLLTLKPHANDQLASSAYLHTLQVGLVRFMGGLESTPETQASFAAILASSYDRIPELLALVSEGLLSPKLDVVKASAKAMSEIMRKTITHNMISQSMTEAAHAASLKKPTGKAAAASAAVVPPFYRVIELMENLLSYRYKSQWNRILLLVGELFHASANLPTAQALLIPLLRHLDQLHTAAAAEVASEDPSLDYRPALDEALGAAISALGAEGVLAVLPLDLPLDYYSRAGKLVPLHEQLTQSRAWLIPLFRSYLHNCSFTFFLDFFAPVAASCHDLEKLSAQQGKHVEARAFQGLKIGIWDIFPSVCGALPPDVAETFKPLLRRLIDAHLNVDEQAFTHTAICKGLGSLVRKLREIVSEATAQASKQSSSSAVAQSASDDDEDDDEAAAKAAFDDESDEDDESGDEEEEGSALAADKAKRRAKKAEAVARAVLAATAKPAAGASIAPVAKSSSHSRRYPALYNSTQAQTLLDSTIAPLTKHLLPVLFNLAAMPREHKESVFECIAQYAAISDSELLNKTFKTVLRKLLEHTTAMQAKQTAKEEAAAAATAAAESKDGEAMEATATAPAVTPAELQRAHLLTDIVASLCLASCASLNADNLGYLYKILQHQLASDEIEGSLQKKTYKILANLMEQHPTFFKAQWKQLVADLSAAAATQQSAALKQRLACVRLVLLQLPELMLRDKSAQSLLPAYLGEVILGSKEISAKTRDFAFSVLIELGHKMLAVQDAKLAQLGGADRRSMFGGLSQPDADQPLMAEYIYVIAAGLAGSNHMQSASVLCLARMMYEFKTVLSGELVGSVLRTVLPLFESKSRELIKSLLTFIKVVVLSFTADALESHLPGIVNGLVLWCEHKKQRFKLKIKVLFEIIMKKVGVDSVMELVPPQHTALVEHIRKTKEREKRQKTEHWRATRKEKEEATGSDGLSHKSLQDYDSIMKDPELAAEDAAAAAGPLSAAANKAAKAKAMASKKEASSMWLRDGNVDFLDPAVVSKSVSASNPAADVNTKRALSLGHGVTQDAAGKLVIGSGARQTTLSAPASAALMDIEELSAELKSKHKEKRKRQSEEDGDDGADVGPDAKRVQQAPGQQFRSSKAGGDMKRRGQLDPYAFVPLNPAGMNKRKKFTAQRRLESIVTAAKEGSQAGSASAKSKARSNKNKGHKKHGH